MTQAPESFEFCQYVDKATRKRCVAGRGHGGPKHDLQPLTSASVQTIMRQEDAMLRLGYDRPVEENAAIVKGDPSREGMISAADMKAPEGPQSK